jgi:hypothetical protein
LFPAAITPSRNLNMATNMTIHMDCRHQIWCANCQCKKQILSLEWLIMFWAAPRRRHRNAAKGLNSVSLWWWSAVELEESGYQSCWRQLPLRYSCCKLHPQTKNSTNSHSHEFMFMFGKTANFRIHISPHYESLQASPVVLSMWPYKSTFHIQV